MKISEELKQEIKNTLPVLQFDRLKKYYEEYHKVK